LVEDKIILNESLTNQLIRLGDGSTYQRIVRNIEDYGHDSIYGEVVVNDVTWVVRRMKAGAWTAIGTRAALDAAEQGLEADATIEQQRRLATSTWKECIARNL
jgi:hypothetical protein